MSRMHRKSQKRIVLKNGGVVASLFLVKINIYTTNSELCILIRKKMHKFTKSLILCLHLCNPYVILIKVAFI